MPHVKTPPIDNQGVLFDADAERESLEMAQLNAENPRVAFGRVVMPYFFGKYPDSYRDITERMVQAINPERMAPYLFHAASQFRVDDVTLPADEYERIVRSPAAFGSAVMGKTYAARGLDRNVGRRLEAAQHSGEVAFEQKFGAMQRTLEGLHTERSTVSRLRRRALSAGFANERFQSLHQMAVTTRNAYFDRILGVVGREKEWSTEQADLASRALDVRLLWGGEQGLNSRVGHWREWLDLGLEYASRREDLFGRRVDTVAGILGIQPISETVEVESIEQ